MNHSAPLEIRYFGVSAFEIVTEKGFRIIIDPYISKNPVCPIKLDEIKKADIILVTHGAADHVGDLAELAKRTGATVLCGHDVRAHALREGVPKQQVIRVPYGLAKKIAGVTIRCVESRHVSFIDWGDGFISAQPLGFVIHTESGVGIYHSGDTSLFGDMKLIGQLYRPKIAMINVGAEWMSGRHDPDSVAHDPFEMALATQWIGPEIVIPMHHDPRTNDPMVFAEHVKLTAPWVKTVIMKPGETFKYARQ